ncbi:hypothetical protein HanIR_Chr04g0185761 [Helianthus annuus]|nr:hypothetical protein HanIR_Chr04g0185761 [Helianthus annuus]
MIDHLRSYSRAIAVWITVTCQINHWCLAVAKGCKKREVDKIIVPCRARLSQGTLTPVLTPVDCNATSIGTHC